MTVSSKQVALLSGKAWHARQYDPRNSSGIRVGAAVLVRSGFTFASRAIELPYRQGLHAEAAALVAMTAALPDAVPVAMVIATPDFKAPCGSCQDWMNALGPNMLVVIEDSPGHERANWYLDELCHQRP